MIREHVKAFTDLVDAQAPPVPWYLGESPAGAVGGYAVFYPDTGNRESVDFADANPMRMWTITANYSGADIDQVLLIAELVEKAVEGVRPVVAGRSCTRIVRIIARPVTREDDVSPARFYGVDVWRWSSTPA